MMSEKQTFVAESQSNWSYYVKGVILEMVINVLETTTIYILYLSTSF